MQAQQISRSDVRDYVGSVIGRGEHAARVLSISNAVMGVVHGTALAIHAIGAALAESAGLAAKHATKQVDRLLSNAGYDLQARFVDWVRYIIGEQKHIVVALDWTDYDADGQATISLALVPTGRGRATPLIWRTVHKDELKGQRHRFEDELLVRFHEAVPQGVRVTVTADRGFGDQQLFSFLETLKFDYIIRIKGDITVATTFENGRAAKRWLRADGRMVRLRQALITQGCTPVAAFVAIHDKRMKDPWFLVSSFGASEE